MEKKRQDLVASLRELVVVCSLTAKWEERGKMAKEDAYRVLKRGMFRAEGILKALAREGKL